MQDMPAESPETEITQSLETALPEAPPVVVSAKSVRLKQQELRHKNKKRPRVIAFLLCGLLLLGILVSVFGYTAYRSYSADYQRYLSFAHVGIQHLQTAEKLLVAYPQNPFDAQHVDQAQHEFSIAKTNFVLLDNGLKSLPSIATAIPVYGTRLGAALHIVPLAVEVSQAGLIGCDILKLLAMRFHIMLTTKAQDLTLTDITTIRSDLLQLKGIISLASDQTKHLSPADLQLDARLSKLIGIFHQYAPILLAAFDDLGALLPAIPALLGIGTETNYLIEILDTSELRPGGGFIGNYGILTLLNGQQLAAHITDVDLLDRPFEAAGHVIPFPRAYQWFDLAPQSWSLRDANLDADFPTVARYSEQNYVREGGQTPFEGVIAITPALIQNMLTITGPIPIPEYHEVVTAQNLTERIHYHQLAADEGLDTVVASDGQSSQRKHFTAVLAEHFMDRFHQIPATSMPAIIQILTKALHTKDLQVYFNSPVAESFLQRSQIDSTIQAPNSDSLLIVDANIAPSKANQFITNTLEDQVTLDAQGDAIHTTKISYAWTTPGPVYGAATYRDYARIYVPPGSILQSQNGWENRGTSSAFGRTVWAGFFTLTFGQTRVITLQWRVPKAATKDTRGWHYNYLLQHQAGTRWIVNLPIVLPTCAHISRILGPLTYGNQHVTPPHILNEDTNMSIDYSGC